MFAAFVLAASASTVATPRTGHGVAPDSLRPWARGLIGRWSCAGAFSNGKALAADVEFTSILGGRWLEYHHKDRAPGSYEALAILGPARRDTALEATTLHDIGGGARRFLLSAGDSGVMLDRDTTQRGARVERFRFVLRGTHALWFAWEIGAGGRWAIGDSLGCSPA